MQPCAVCGQLTRSKFGVCKRMPDCAREHHRRQQVEWRAANVTKSRDGAMLRYSKNKKRNHERSAAWYAAHPEIRLEVERKWNAAHPDKRRAISRRGAAVRRARKRMVVVENISPEEIFRRDAWVCQRCGRRTRPTFKNTHGLYPNLDHIIPLSAGGPHTAANTQCLCRSCNMKKNNRTGGDQLILIG